MPILCRSLSLSILSPGALAQSCPPEADQGIFCAADDFTITSAILEGPAGCTEGRTIGPVIRVGLEATGSERYDIGASIGKMNGLLGVGLLTYSVE